jgi:D-sedoheptulose 7-phosphate isomerase
LIEGFGTGIIKNYMNDSLLSSAGGWKQHVEDLRSLLSGLSCADRGGEALAPDEAFARWRDWAVSCREARRTIYLIGNGASASMASHFAADLAKNAHLHTEVFSDLSLVTAIANDMGYDQVFSEPLSRRAAEGDMLVAISSSGQSRNILGAVEVATERRLTVVTLSGMAPDNPLRMAGDLNFHVAATTYGHVETAHATILHHWMDMLERRGEA